MSNFLGKLKDIIGGGQEDFQYYEQEIESMTNPETSTKEGKSEAAVESGGEMPTAAASTIRRRRGRESQKPEGYSPPSYLDSSHETAVSSFPNNVIGMPGVNNMVAEVVVIEPHSFDEIPQVIQTLKEQRCVVLNLNVMEPEEAQRAVDFVAGGTYAIDGHQERIGESIFLFTPRNVKVSTITGKSYPNRKGGFASEGLKTPMTESFWDERGIGSLS